MEGNIIELFPALRKSPQDPVAKFMEGFVDFSHENGIDTESESWRRNGSAIMSILQAMMADNDRSSSKKIG